jgi:hypothetical protein
MCKIWHALEHCESIFYTETTYLRHPTNTQLYQLSVNNLST